MVRQTLCMTQNSEIVFARPYSLTQDESSGSLVHLRQCVRFARSGSWLILTNISTDIQAQTELTQKVAHSRY